MSSPFAVVDVVTTHVPLPRIVITRKATRRGINITNTLGAAPWSVA
jgi:hypothetical protein